MTQDNRAQNGSKNRQSMDQGTHSQFTNLAAQIKSAYKTKSQEPANKAEKSVAIIEKALKEIPRAAPQAPPSPFKIGAKKDVNIRVQTAPKPVSTTTPRPVMQATARPLVNKPVPARPASPRPLAHNPLSSPLTRPLEKAKSATADLLKVTTAAPSSTPEDAFMLSFENGPAQTNAAPSPPPALSPCAPQPSAPVDDSQDKSLRPAQLYAMAKMGYTQWEYGKLDRARAIFQTLVVQKPKEAWFRCALGSIFQKQKQYAQAIQQYTIALELDPKDLPSRVNRGEILLKVGKHKEASYDLHQAMQMDISGKHPAALRARSLLAAVRHVLPGEAS